MAPGVGDSRGSRCGAGSTVLRPPACVARPPMMLQPRAQLPGAAASRGSGIGARRARVSSSDAVADARIKVRVRARSRKDELIGVRDGVLLARVSAPRWTAARTALCVV